MTVVVGAVIACALFGSAFVRLRRRRSERAPWSRIALFGGGIAALIVPLLSLDAVAEDRLWAHMLQHTLIGDLAPVLLVLAVRGPLSFFLLPPQVLKPLASSASLRAGLGFLLRPVVSFTAWTLAILAWHLPAAYDVAVSHSAVHIVEHLCFIVAGSLAWMQLVDPARHQRLSRRGKIAFAFGLVAVTQPLMSALFFAPFAIYDAYPSVTDQRIAACVMLVDQLILYGGFIALQLRPLLGADAPVEGRA
jgi:cytochrome c oxidase assembly factor CtaG